MADTARPEEWGKPKLASITVDFGDGDRGKVVVVCCEAADGHIACEVADEKSPALQIEIDISTQSVSNYEFCELGSLDVLERKNVEDLRELNQLNRKTRFGRVTMARALWLVISSGMEHRDAIQEAAKISSKYRNALAVKSGAF